MVVEHSRKRKIMTRDGELEILGESLKSAKSLHGIVTWADENNILLKSLSIEPVYYRGGSWKSTEESTEILPVIYAVRASKKDVEELVILRKDLGYEVFKYRERA